MNSAPVDLPASCPRFEYSKQRATQGYAGLTSHSRQSKASGHP